jgi:mannose-6-phosphate isomerase-like protein (cupin superfamily)
MHDGDTISERPWGNYIKLYQESGVWVKRVQVNPGMRLSLQRHNQRSEKWIVVCGEGFAVIGSKGYPLKTGDVIDVPQGAIHRIGNTGQGKLIFIEVATGPDLTENDIERLQDDYEREK